jgi:hypothetical protein
VARDAVAAIDRGEGVATGDDGRYLVVWDDAYYFGSQGYGLVSELERAGLDAGVLERSHVPVTDHRVMSVDEATAQVVLATGERVDVWRGAPGTVEVAFVDPRSAAERDEFDRLRSDVIRDLEADGLDDVVEAVDANLFGASIDERISGRAERMMVRMLELGEPTAVFIAPPGTTT